MTSEMKNLKKSIRQRLLNISRDKKEDFQLILIRFALERFLYRLSKSKYADQFILKGAFLFMVWTEQQHRPTRDIDFLCFGDSSAERLTRIFQEICCTEVEPDGLVFDVHSISLSEIREEQEYEGQRVKLMALLGKARISLQIDVAFGDAITPHVHEVDFPSLLEMPTPRIRTYPKETVVAEKLQSIIYLGMQNSRMKDFFDLFWLSRVFPFDGNVLVKAIRATFQRRKTDIPSQLPLALSDEFSLNPVKQTQWKAFLNKNGMLELPENFTDIIAKLRKFLVPALNAAAGNDIFPLSWPSGGPWQHKHH